MRCIRKHLLLSRRIEWEVIICHFRNTLGRVNLTAEKEELEQSAGLEVLH